jgi:hypothetical protein
LVSKFILLGPHGTSLRISIYLLLEARWNGLLDLYLLKFDERVTRPDTASFNRPRRKIYDRSGEITHVGPFYDYESLA